MFAVDTSSLQITAQVSTGYFPTSVAVSSDGTTAYVTSCGEKSLSEIDTADNTVKYTLRKVGRCPRSVALYPLQQVFIHVAQGRNLYFRHVGRSVNVVFAAPIQSARPGRRDAASRRGDNFHTARGVRAHAGMQ